jgi:hypothetical protein
MQAVLTHPPCILAQASIVRNGLPSSPGLPEHPMLLMTLFPILSSAQQSEVFRNGDQFTQFLCTQLSNGYALNLWSKPALRKALHNPPPVPTMVLLPPHWLRKSQPWLPHGSLSKANGHFGVRCFAPSPKAHPI